MNRLKGSLAAKIAAIILLAVSGLTLCAAIFSIAWLDNQGAYQNKSIESVRAAFIDKRLQITCFDLLERMRAYAVSSAYDSTVCFVLLDQNGRVLAGNGNDTESVERTLAVPVGDYYGGLYFISENQPLITGDRFTRSYSSGYGYEMAPVPTPSVTPTPVPTGSPEEQTGEASAMAGTKVYTVSLAWTRASESEELDRELGAYERLYPLRYTLIALGAAALLLAVLLLVFLLAAAGHHDASDAVRAGVIERIPFDILFLIGGTGVSALVMIIDTTFNSRQLVLSYVIAAICLTLAGLLILLFLMSAAVRLKQKTLLSGCLCWRVLLWGWQWLKRAFRAALALLHGLPLVWKWLPLYAVLLLIDWWLSLSFRYDTDMLFLVFLLRWGLVAAAVLYAVLCLRRLREGTRAIADGKETVVIDTKYMIGDCKAQAEDLMHIRDGLSRAVDERMRAERLRTELITNVSHDIKTPLTSIVNYVDLLSREELPEGKAAEYLAVLQRQSARLKKLTDDLVEASKASTGNLPVTVEPLDLGVLMEQLQGEYGERLTEKQLKLIVTKPEAKVTVRSDPRHLWRVLDNLMNNVLKYAMPGTRVYLDCEIENGRPALQLRNISAEPLPIRPEELTERFVRGDSARSTEGSGLGLAIAASLCKLQNIELNLVIDGDLFKVTLLFP